MLDLAIIGGSVVDGSGAPPSPADIGIKDGRIAVVGRIEEPAARTVDATGLIVCPGFIDPHTHYDAQLFWDPHASPSNVHGVTTVIGGNCGFTLAPLRSVDADYTRKMMAKVEGMPLAALEAGVPWTWEHFSEYLAALDGRLGVNAGFLVGHCALRRYVLGDDSVRRESTGDELAAIVAVLRASLEAGALGFSTSRSSTHNDGDGVAVPSRWASVEEVLALCDAVGEYEGTTLEAIVEGCLSKFSDDEIELFAQMSAHARRPLNWNVLGTDASSADKVARQMTASSRAREIGGRVVALTMPMHVPMNMSFGTFCALWLIPGWADVLSLPLADKKAKLADPGVRADLLLKAAGSATFAGLAANLGRFVIGDTFSGANEGLTGRRVSDIAAERGLDDFACVLEIAAADDYRTVLWPQPGTDSAADWEARRDLWVQEDVLLGGSDAGAHLDRMCGSPYPTTLLGDCLRGRRLLPVEAAVRLLTDVPARLFGLTGRGRVEVGAWADVVVFDPATVGAGPATLVPDLPSGAKRLVAASTGVRHVFVNGVEAVVDGESTGAIAGRVLRSGKDTETVRTG